MCNTSCNNELFTFTDKGHETKSATVATSVFIAVIVVLLTGSVITVVVYVTVKKFRKQHRKRITAASDERTNQSPNVYSTTSPNDVPTNFRERKVILISINTY